MQTAHRRSVSSAPPSLGLLAFAFLAGCATPAPSPGRLEMVVDPSASFGVVGRFRVNHIGAADESRVLDFDGSTPRREVSLPPGSYTLTLEAGARLRCPGEESSDSLPGVSAGTRLVSSWPRRITIEAGEVTTARIGFGAPSSAVTHPRLAHPNVAAVTSPCDPHALADAGASMLSRRW